MIFAHDMYDMYDMYNNIKRYINALFLLFAVYIYYIYSISTKVILFSLACLIQEPEYWINMFFISVLDAARLGKCGMRIVSALVNPWQ